MFLARNGNCRDLLKRPPFGLFLLAQIPQIKQYQAACTSLIFDVIPRVVPNRKEAVQERLRRLLRNADRLLVLSIFLAIFGARAATLVVTNASDSGPGTLRQAILDANSAAGLDTITFQLGGAAPFTISPVSALPSVTDPVLLMGLHSQDTSATLSSS